MAPTTILITGANRGLGLGLAKQLLALPNHTIIAANRDPSHPTSQALANLPTGDGSRVVVVQYDASVEGAAFAAVKQAQEKAGITHLDIVVANAAIVKVYPHVKEAKRSDILEHFSVNALGPVELFQATRDLLEKSADKPKFVFLGSGAGALGRQPQIPNAAYGPSKTVLAWYGVRLHAEEEWLSTFVIDPGWAQTEMGNGAAEHFGYSSAPVTEEDSVNGIFKIVTAGTRGEYGGKVVLYTGEVQVY